MKLNTTLSFKRQNVDFSFTEPYFMGMPISAGIDLFATKSDNNRHFVLSKAPTLASPCAPVSSSTSIRSLGFKYTLAYRDVDGINYDKASPAIIAQEGSTH